MANLQNRQQAMLSDQAATNAASQFNATSAQQMQQFMSSLVQSTLTHYLHLYPIVRLLLGLCPSLFDMQHSHHHS